jgi:hypothetical protein
VGKIRIVYGAGTIILQAAVHPKCTLGALNMREQEEATMRIFASNQRITTRYTMCTETHVKFMNSENGKTANPEIYCD